VTGSQKRVRSSVNEEKALNVVMAHPFAMAGVNSGAVVASESGNRSGGAGDYCKSGDEGEGAGEYKSGDEGGGALSAEDAEVQKVIGGKDGEDTYDSEDELGKFDETGSETSCSPVKVESIAHLVDLMEKDAEGANKYFIPPEISETQEYKEFIEKQDAYEDFEIDSIPKYKDKFLDDEEK